MIYNDIAEYMENDSNLVKHTIARLHFEKQIFVEKADNLEKRIDKAKKEYLKKLQECNEKNVKIADIAVDMFNILEGNIKN